jgi:hypothetical protein
MKKKDDEKSIAENVKWFKKFPLEKRLEIAFNDIKAIKILRSLTPKKHATAH